MSNFFLTSNGKNAFSISDMLTCSQFIVTDMKNTERYSELPKEMQDTAVQEPYVILGIDKDGEEKIIGYETEQEAKSDLSRLLTMMKEYETQKHNEYQEKKNKFVDLASMLSSLGLSGEEKDKWVDVLTSMVLDDAKTEV